MSLSLPPPRPLRCWLVPNTRAPFEPAKRGKGCGLKEQVRDPALKRGAEPKQFLAVRPHEDMPLWVNDDHLRQRVRASITNDWE